MTWFAVAVQTRRRHAAYRGPLDGVMAFILLLSPLPVSAEPPDEYGALQEASSRFADAQRKVDEGDHDGAVTLLEDGLERIPEGPGYAPVRARMLLLIVEAHEVGFKSDGDLERLRQAKRLLDRYLGPLELLDEQGRGEAEDRRSALIAMIANIEDSRRRAEADRMARELRQQAEDSRKQANRLRIAGVVTTSIGAAGLALMGAGLGVGGAAEAKIDQLHKKYENSQPCAPESPDCTDRFLTFQDARRRGTSGNVMSVVGATVGGALLATGVTLLLVARKRLRETKGLQIAPTPTVSQNDVGLAFVGRF